MWQVFINITYSFSLYLILACGINLNFKVTKSINLTYAALITIPPFIVYSFSKFYNILSLVISSFVAIIIVVSLNIIFEIVIFSWFRRKNNKPLTSLIASIGLYIIIQNIISMIWGDSNKIISLTFSNESIKFFNGYITSNQIIITLVCILFSVLYFYIQGYTFFGKKIKAISSNTQLSEIYGLNVNYIVLVSSILSAIYCSVAGILISLDIGLYPTLGFNLFIYGIIVIIISGINSNAGLILGALLLSSVQHFSTFIFDSKWFELISYITLILFLSWRPLGFSGNKLKKVEV